jgi:5-methylthioadenosine/S-adenosylhomocysteine deaminase
MKTWIKNIDIITSDTSNMVIKNASILIHDDRIEQIIQSSDEGKDVQADRVVDGKGKLAIPGLINAHTHTPMTILRNVANDLALEEWLFENIFPLEAKFSAEDVYWGSMLGIAEMIQSGTTSFADMYYFVDQTAHAVEQSGIRANLSFSAYSFTFENGAPVFKDNTKGFEAFFSEYQGAFDHRLNVSVLIHSPYIYDMKTMTESAQVAKDLGSGIHIHLLETDTERKNTFEKYGESAAFACERAGVFDVPCIAAHCVHLNEEDMNVLKRHDVHIAHNPTSNLKLGSGIAKIPQMQSKNLNIALGTDGTASNNNLNMFEEMNLASLIHKGHQQNPLLVTAEEAFVMATHNGAKALGIGHQTGQIKEGYLADIVLLDVEKVHHVPYYNPVSSVVYAGQSSDVSFVMIHGKVVYEKGEFLTIDVEKTKSKVKEIVRRLGR